MEQQNIQRSTMDLSQSRPQYTLWKPEFKTEMNINGSDLPTIPIVSWRTYTEEK